jgi:hypothetical protein
MLTEPAINICQVLETSGDALISMRWESTDPTAQAMAAMINDSHSHPFGTVERCNQSAVRSHRAANVDRSARGTACELEPKACSCLTTLTSKEDSFAATNVMHYTTCS